jgi:RNA polymerase sigma-70 factor (ECF subfamily)
MESNIKVQDDVELVRAAQLNPAAFKQLYQKWLTPVYRYFYFRVGSKTEAEDLTSQVFLKAFESLPRYKDRGSFSAWLFSIAHAKVVDYYRRASRETTSTMVDEGGDSQADIQANEDLRMVMQLLAKCSEEEQEMVRLRYMAELNYRQIGDILNRSEEAVRKSITRLINRLQAQMEEQND